MYKEGAQWTSIPFQLLHATETGISHDRVGLLGLCDFTFTLHVHEDRLLRIAALSDF